MRPYLLLFLLTFSPWASTLAQEHFQVNKGTEFVQMHSKQTGRDYTLLINLPQSYADNPDKKYPILYYTDAQWDASLISPILGKCNYDRTLPEVILVGISYPDPNANYDALRSWDLTPTKEEGARAAITGGGPKFLKWITEDLIPTVETKYRVDPEKRAWGGVSLGGFYALYVLYERPDLFKRVISISPAVIIDKGFTFRQDKAYAAKQSELDARLYVCYGSGEYDKYSAPIALYQKTVAEREYQGMELLTERIEGARHGSVAVEGWMHGMWWAFEDITPDVPGPLEEMLKGLELEIDSGE